MPVTLKPALLSKLLESLQASTRVVLSWIFIGTSFTILVYVLMRALLFETSMTTNQGLNLFLWIASAAAALLVTRLTIKSAGYPPSSIGIVAVIAGFLYFRTSAPWIYVNRDPGFLSSGSLLFFEAPLRQLDPVAFEGLKWPGFYAVDTGIVVQGFPGFYAVASNEVFFTGTFPQFTTQVTSTLAIFWIGWVLWKIGKSNIWITTALQIALATSVPWLYVARNPFTESLAAFVFLVGLFAVLSFAKSKENESGWLWVVLLIIVFGVANFTRIDGPITTVLPLGIMVIALFIRDRWRDPRGLYILVVGLLCSIVTFLQGRSFSPVYFMDLGRYANAELFLLSGFALISLGAGALPFALTVVRKLMESRVMDTVARMAPSVVILVAPLSWLVRTSETRFEYSLLPLATIASYLGIAVGLSFVVGYVMTSVKRRWLFDDYGWLILGSVFVFSTYLQNPLVFGDEPWASRRFAISTMPLILMLAKLGLDYIDSRLRLILRTPW